VASFLITRACEFSLDIFFVGFLRHTTHIQRGDTERERERAKGRGEIGAYAQRIETLIATLYVIQTNQPQAMKFAHIAAALSIEITWYLVLTHICSLYGIILRGGKPLCNSL